MSKKSPKPKPRKSAAPGSFESDFKVASRRAEAWLGFVHRITYFGKLGRVDPAYKLLEILQNEYYKHRDNLNAVADQLRPLSDSPFNWGLGRGWSGILKSDGPVSCWSSAHEAAVGIAEITLAALFGPLEGITPAEQFALAKRLLANHWQALVIKDDELAALRERIRRERAKLLATGTAPKSDDPWLPAEPPKECAKRMKCHISTLRRYIKNGTVRCEAVPNARLWRLHRDDVRKLGGSLD